MDNGFDDKKESCCVLANGKLEEIMQEFEQFRESNEQYQARGRVAVKQIAEMHSLVEEVHSHMGNLQNLSSIARTNESIATNFDALCKKIGVMEEGSLAAALGKKQVPMSIFLIVTLVFAVAFLLKFLEDRQFDASPTSLRIGPHHIFGPQLPDSDSKKNPDGNE